MGKESTKLAFTGWKRLGSIRSREERELLGVDLFSAAAFQLSSFSWRLWRFPAHGSPADYGSFIDISELGGKIVIVSR